MRLQTLENSAVTNNSVVISSGKVLEHSCVTKEHFEKYQKFKFRLKYFFPIFCRSNKPYILITDEWSKNYCHWIWESLSKLIDLKKKFPDATLILPQSYLKIDFITKSLAAFNFNKHNIKSIPSKSHLYLKKLAFIPCINIRTPDYYDFLKFNELAQTLVSYYQDHLKINFGERIYISRNNPEKQVLRQIKNEKELISILDKYNFKVIYMENFSFLEQISITLKAKFIVASHGAGITNVMFSSSNCRLFELINENWQHETCFEKMCEKMKIFYQRLDCEEIFEEKRNMELRDIKVNIEVFEKNLINFLK